MVEEFDDDKFDVLGEMFGQVHPIVQQQLIAEMATGFANRARKILEDYTGLTPDCTDKDIERFYEKIDDPHFLRMLTVGFAAIARNWQGLIDSYEILISGLASKADELKDEIEAIRKKAEMN